MDDEGETLLIFGHGVIGQGQLCPPARGCHALRYLVSICQLWPCPLTYNINRVHPLVIVNMSTKFDEAVHNSIVAIAFTRIRHDATHGLTQPWQLYYIPFATCCTGIIMTINSTFLLDKCYRCLYEPVTWYWLGWTEFPFSHFGRETDLLNKGTRVQIQADAIQFFIFVFASMINGTQCWDSGVFFVLNKHSSSNLQQCDWTPLSKMRFHEWRGNMSRLLNTYCKTLFIREDFIFA